MFAGLRKLAAATGFGAGNNCNRSDSTDITSLTNDERATNMSSNGGSCNINNRTLVNELEDIGIVASSNDMMGKKTTVVGDSHRRSNTTTHAQSSANLLDTQQGGNDINTE